MYHVLYIPTSSTSRMTLDLLKRPRRAAAAVTDRGHTSLESHNLENCNRHETNRSTQLLELSLDLRAISIVSSSHSYICLDPHTGLATARDCCVPCCSPVILEDFTQSISGLPCRARSQCLSRPQLRAYCVDLILTAEIHLRPQLEFQSMTQYSQSLLHTRLHKNRNGC